MADILPFRGIRYDPIAVAGELADVLAPPYDVISPAEQQELYDRSPENVVRLILGREEDRYQSANRLFHEWLSRGVLVADDRPALYVYTQRFADPVTGKPAPERIGLICLLKLEEYASGKVLPHENTLTAAKVDRLDLLRATNAQFESIYGLFSDRNKSVRSFATFCTDREPALVHVDDMIGSSHTVKRITDPRAIDILKMPLEDEPIFIADGHHRYETALNYRREVRKQFDVPDSQSIPADYILITLTAFQDHGLLVLPTHRMVKGLDASLVADLPNALGRNGFGVIEADPSVIERAIEDTAKLGRKAVSIVLPQTGATARGLGVRTLLATLNASLDEIPGLIPGVESDALKRLDVTILQRLILQERLGITTDMLAAGGHVGYTRDMKEAIESVATGKYQVAFILGRPSVDDVRLVSLAGDKMPQKSTFFYPKLLSGLIMRDLGRDNTGEVSAQHGE
jgi:uncharacterized protein (DUF1015 family)